MIQWPDELVEDVARRRVVLYLGAGVSAGALSEGEEHPPTWMEFLNRALERLKGNKPSRTIRKLIKENDLLTACELLKTALDETWPELLKEQFLAPRYTPGPLHRALWELDSALVLTPNFDSIYDRFASHETRGETVVKSYTDRDVPLYIRRNYRAVLKVHGSIETPVDMVFTRADYARIRVTHRSFFDLVSALFLTHTFLFVGTSLNDPDLRLFLENHHRGHENSPPHYMTTPQGSLSIDLDDSIRSNMNLKLLRYSSRNGHVELAESVNQLVTDVGKKRDQLASLQRW